MPNFSMVLTAAGAELLAKGVAGKTMQFTAIAVGDGTFSGSPVDATALQREVKRLPIQRMTRRKNTVSLRATLEAGTVKSGFIWTELGVFATDPDTQGDVLYMYGYAGAESDAVPAANEPTIIEKIINVTAIVASAENVTAIIDTSLVYLTQADLEAHNADPEANPAAIQAHNDNPKAHEVLFSQKADLGEDGKIPDEQLPDMDYVARTWDTMTGNLTMSDGATVTGLPTPSGNADAVPKSFLTAQLSNYLARSGGTMSGTINMNSKKITNLPTPTANGDAVPKSYLDQQVIANRRWKEIDRITTSKTWTVPSGVTQIGVLAIGGGESGNVVTFPSNVNFQYVIGGFSGHAISKILDVSPGDSFSVEIGIGGVASIDGKSTKQPGGNTIFRGKNSTITAYGGGIIVNGIAGGCGLNFAGSIGRGQNYDLLISQYKPKAHGLTPNLVGLTAYRAGTSDSYAILYTFSDYLYPFTDLPILSSGGIISVNKNTGDVLSVPAFDLGNLGKGGDSIYLKSGNGTGNNATGYGNGGGSVVSPTLGTAELKAGNGSPGIVIIYA